MTITIVYVVEFQCPLSLVCLMVHVLGECILKLPRTYVHLSIGKYVSVLGAQLL
jgi:hypothetical protein